MPKDKSVKTKHGGHSDRSSRWGIVVNLGGETENPIDWKPIEYVKQLMYFYAWVKHRGEETERDHYHLFVHMRRSWALKPLLTFLGVGSGYKHKLLYTDDIGYLTDGHTTVDGPYTYGTQDVTAGTRTDIAEALSMAKSGSSVQDIIMHQPQLLPYTRIIDEFFIHPDTKPSTWKREVCVIVFWGPTSTGKSERIKARHWPDYYEVKSGRGPWDKYSGETVVEFSEFSSSKWSAQDILTLIDVHYTQLDCRGSNKNKWSTYTTVYMTSNYHPDTWYSNYPGPTRDAIRARIQHVVEVTSQSQEVDFDSFNYIQRKK